MTVINTNSSAILAANALTKNDRAMGQSMERLSTGLRINSAADDAAGLAISSKLTSQIRGLDQAARNANDAISMIQTADGAAIEISNMLQRMREVVVQANNGTNTTADVANLNVEFSALADEIDRIVNATEWNGMSILDGNSGSSGTFTFQIGANDSQTLDVSFSDFNLAAGSAAVTTAVTAVAAVQSLSIGTLAGWDAGDTITVGTTAVTLATADYASITAFADALESGLSGYTATGTGTTITLTQTTGTDLTAASSLTSTGFTGTAALSLTTTGVTAVAISDATPMASDLSGALSTATTGTITVTTASIIDTIDSALAGVASQRATFGAAINRLEYTVDNLANVSQNTSASRSRIQDADYASETTELARTQIIQQAGTAMLAQANQQAQSVLSLLKS